MHLWMVHMDRNVLDYLNRDIMFNEAGGAWKGSDFFSNPLKKEYLLKVWSQNFRPNKLLKLLPGSLQP